MRELWNRTRDRMTPSRSGEEFDHKDKRKTRVLQEFVQNDIQVFYRRGERQMRRSTAAQPARTSIISAGRQLPNGEWAD